MSAQITTAEVVENGKSPYAVTIRVSGFELVGDEPVSFGGGNTGPAPYDFLTTALAECTAMTIRWYALQKKWPLQRVDVAVTHHKDESKKDFFDKKIHIVGSELTDEQRSKLYDVAAKCPVQRTIENGATITSQKVAS